MDFRRAARTGPGYHDHQWELGKTSYPDVFVRWNSQRNFELCLRLISEGRLNVDCLTSHRIPLESITEEIDRTIDQPENIFGVVIEMK